MAGSLYVHPDWFLFYFFGYLADGMEAHRDPNSWYPRTLEGW
jgi:hypothetical protein